MAAGIPVYVQVFSSQHAMQNSFDRWTHTTGEKNGGSTSNAVIGDGDQMAFIIIRLMQDAPVSTVMHESIHAALYRNKYSQREGAFGEDIPYLTQHIMTRIFDSNLIHNMTWVDYDDYENYIRKGIIK